MNKSNKRNIIIVIASIFAILIIFVIINSQTNITGNSVFSNIIKWFSSFTTTAYGSGSSGSGASGSGSGGINPCQMKGSGGNPTNKPDTTQCSTSTITHGVCKNGVCVPYSCDNVFGSGGWDPCPSNSIKDGKNVAGIYPNCCLKGETCTEPSNFESGDDAACCPVDTYAKSTFGFRYCEKTQKYCDRLYGADPAWTPCVGTCCKPGTLCKTSGFLPVCVEKTDDCAVNTTLCKTVDGFPLCCVNGKEICKNGDTGQRITGTSSDKFVNCFPLSDSCKSDETYCPGVSTTKYKYMGFCCPSGSKCAQHPDGTPNCVNSNTVNPVR